MQHTANCACVDCCTGRQAGHAGGAPQRAYSQLSCVCIQSRCQFAYLLLTGAQVAKLDMPEVPDKQRREKFVLSVAYSPGEGRACWTYRHSAACLFLHL